MWEIFPTASYLNVGQIVSCLLIKHVYNYLTLESAKIPKHVLIIVFETDQFIDTHVYIHKLLFIWL